MNYLLELVNDYQIGCEEKYYVLMDELNQNLLNLKNKYGEDIVEEVILRFNKKLKRLNIEVVKEQEVDHSRNYLNKMMENLAKEILVKENKECKRKYLIGDFSIFENNKSLQYDFYTEFEIKEALKILTNEEYKVIILIFFENYKVCEIAEMDQVSRQDINQIKLNALRKLKMELAC